ncbi:TonB-dependent receptor [Sphingobacterium sp. LRF_L2]|uniref:TonB-dependent receptor n=1 Tax=Sphingobacterium sp. LRF_L2 TaxID=3369421 RepID=UPI003F60F140
MPSPFQLFTCFFFLSTQLSTFAQHKIDMDSTSIPPIHIHAYFSEQPLLGLTSSAQSINQNSIQRQQTTSLLSSINTVSGIRMEERSPGSYRLAMRGSLIRSAFGIRNVKIYVNEFPLTDAGGNTYLNLLDPFSIASIDVLKGPDGSLYGANSGGVIRIEPKGFENIDNRAALQVSGGSYGLFQEQLSIQRKINNKYQFSIDHSFLRSDGYRVNTALNKKTFQTTQQSQYSSAARIKLFLLYTDLGYRTPGGLTAAQAEENPRQARPATSAAPGAYEQKAGIYNKTLYGGIAHETKLSKYLSHKMMIFGSNTNLENPFITNYEIRHEKNLGIRTFFSLSNEESSEFTWQMQLGFEGQKGWNDINNYENAGGIAGTAQESDNLNNKQSSFFYRTMIKIAQKWTWEASIGLNQTSIAYTRHYPVEENPNGQINLDAIWIPRLASSYLITDQLALRASISKGYSPPTLAEIRPSGNQINKELQAEAGVNYEVGVRIETKNRRLMVDLSAYSYQMTNGIVRLLGENDTERYVNAGEMDQKGIEGSLFAQIIKPSNTNFIRGLSYHHALSRNFYTFGNYITDSGNFSGNKITAVPDWTISNSLSMQLPASLFLNVYHQYVSEIPLNDANSIYAKKYNLVQTKAGITIPTKQKVALQVFGGIDNLFNESYSLGNDINAFGNRFFNPAPARNYYLGAKISL